ncbi:MAG: hypothetical protein Q4B50_06205 [Bacillota bacterium]|nr:hypothetical protein [Bacillota bacterium]
MLFISPEDFFEKVRGMQPLSRAEEKHWALQMQAGDEAGREALICAYLPMVAAVLRRLQPASLRLELLLRCCIALEKAVDHFDFLQDSESFTHRLSFCLRQTIVAYFANRRAFYSDPLPEAEKGSA